MHLRKDELVNKNYIKKMLNPHTISIILAFSIFLCSNTIIKGQYKVNQEIGGIIGASYYLGDLNETHFKQSKPLGGISFRKNFDRRFAFKSSLIYSMLYAHDKNSSNAEHVNRNLHFRNYIIDLSGQIEFNFLPYEIGNPKYTWTPFLFTGVSIFNHNPETENDNGEWIALQPLGTEGQGTPFYNGRKKYALTQFCLPFGGGMKIAISKDLNMIFEYGIRKTFTDYIDDVSTTYVGVDYAAQEFTSEAIHLNDRSLDGPKLQGDDRGNRLTEDWYSFSSLTLSFKLNNKQKGCNPSN